MPFGLARKNDWRTHLLRRAITVPSFLAATVLGVFIAPAVLGTTFCVDVIRGRRQLPATRATIFFLYFLCCETWGITAALAIWLLTAGGRIGGSRRYMDWNFALQRIWSGALFRGALRIFSMRFETPDVTALPLPHILLVRHASTADSVLAAACIANPLRIHYAYTLKTELLLDPCLDIVGNRIPNAFIDREATRKRLQVERLLALVPAVRSDPRGAFLIFPEGTRFSQDRLQRELARLVAADRSDLLRLARTFQHVLPPRTTGVYALHEALPHAPIVILGHTGFEGARTMGDFLRGDLIGRTIRTKTWFFTADDIPADRNAFDLWLFERWKELDEWILQQRTVPT